MISKLLAIVIYVKEGNDPVVAVDRYLSEHFPLIEGQEIKIMKERILIKSLLYQLLSLEHLAEKDEELGRYCLYHYINCLTEFEQNFRDNLLISLEIIQKL